MLRMTGTSSPMSDAHYLPRRPLPTHKSSTIFEEEYFFIHISTPTNMVADVTLLKTKADCDQALTGLNKKKAVYEHLDYNQSYTSALTTDRSATVSAQLGKATDNVAIIRPKWPAPA